MSWNYRVIKKIINGEVIYQIKEVYYDSKGNIEAYGDAPVPYGESIGDLGDCLSLMEEALEEPVLEYTVEHKEVKI